ncbi:hypothetical protein [Bosea sp. (in: a-proteobacteria)]|uniref:hypothetical protein n=1 Tax=Bosea sp. (in: a-proteobacteria) TaxID=1871050 RepID=UPI001AD29A31|nr:hypothetical protein [Bosea sp. (in: a-proteobacteria)]MBN9444926.1 hypothetical protein [Bosea sp. (in: a-proteobacteria)]
MAYFLRKVAIIGLIAMNSPVHGGKSAEVGPPQAAGQVANAVQAETRAAAGSLAAAREAAQILAGLDPETRGRILSAVASAATTRPTTR